MEIWGRVAGTFCEKFPKLLLMRQHSQKVKSQTQYQKYRNKITIQSWF